MKLVAIQTSLCAVAGRGGDSFNCLGFNVSEMWPDGEGAVGVKPEGGARASTSSDVEVFDERSLPAAGLPNIAQLNVTKSSGVHFGPKFVKVTQNVHNTEVVKGRFLGLELITPKKGNRLRCSVAVFVCWAAVVVTGLAFYLFKYILAVPPTRLDLGIKELWYVRRDDWQAMPEYKMTFHKLPLTYVLIGHSATNYCDEKYACIKQVLGIQSDHLRRGWDDIGPNFLVSGDGLVFEGRGANLIGAMVKYWNSKSITIMFLGDYSQETTRPEQFEHVAALLEVLVTKGVLIKDFIVYGHCQVAPLIITPGKNIMDNIHLLPHWNPANTTGCLR